MRKSLLVFQTAMSFAMASSSLSAQGVASAPSAIPAGTAGVSTASVATATRVNVAPQIDGRGDDAIWATAQLIQGFRVFDPVEDGEPRFRTEARVSYDERNLYVLVRAFDPNPDSIRALLARRDVRTPSDEIKILIDSYHDKRTGFQFAVNPAGVKRDIAVFNDTQEDVSWDAVWDVSTRIDSAGWVAEYRIPLSQLRYAEKQNHTFGLTITRDVARYSERHSWPVYRRSRSGIVSQFGELNGITGIVSPRRLELSPYTVTKTANVRAGSSFEQRTQGAFGADLKYGITSNITLDATVNPDFGQVEADPSLLNLSVFESFFPEKRPFFLEGQGLFRFDVNCNDGSCSGLFYSRRIGRSPQLSDWYPSDANATNTTILGAAKVTGRLSNGMSIAFLDALTEREVSPGERTIEPRTNYMVGRLQQDFRGGRSVVGAMVTNVYRDLDEWSEDVLRRDATSAGIDTRHEFLDRRYAVAAYFAGSLVRGSEEAIARTQRSGVHLYQRPDDDVTYDPTRTSLSGTSFQLSVSKNGGGITRFSTGYQFISPGFEINDVGFLSRANGQNHWLWYAIQLRKPTKLYRQWMTNFNEWQNWTVEGLRRDLGGNINSHMQLTNNWWLHIGQGVESAIPSYCDNCARGGPALRDSRSIWGWAGVDGDNRRAIVPYMYSQYFRGAEGRSKGYSIDPSLTVKMSSRFSTDVSLSYNHNIHDAQWYNNYGDPTSDTTHHTFARLDQKLMSLSTRLNFTATPTLSVEVYARPFMTGGEYSNWRELADPRAASYVSRFQPYNGGVLNDAFNFRQFRSNAVVRWEYRPGSTVYFVWAQERTAAEGGPDAARFNARDDLGELFSSRPGNVFLIKGSYWLSM